VEHVAVLDGERLDLLELPQHERVIVGIAEQPHRQDGIRHRRIDAAEPARHGQTLLEPEARRLDRAAAQGAWREALPDLEAVVDGDEEALPEETAPAEGLGTRENRRLVSSRGTGPARRARDGAAATSPAFDQQHDSGTIQDRRDQYEIS
jgi:hypothetical protein